MGTVTEACGTTLKIRLHVEKAAFDITSTYFQNAFVWVNASANKPVMTTISPGTGPKLADGSPIDSAAYSVSWSYQNQEGPGHDWEGRPPLPTEEAVWKVVGR